jgi:hypothetical protein
MAEGENVLHIITLLILCLYQHPYFHMMKSLQSNLQMHTISFALIYYYAITFQLFPVCNNAVSVHSVYTAKHSKLYNARLVL